MLLRRPSVCCRKRWPLSQALAVFAGIIDPGNDSLRLNYHSPGGIITNPSVSLCVRRPLGPVTDDPGQLPAVVRPLTPPWGTACVRPSGTDLLWPIALSAQIFTRPGDRTLRLNEDERYPAQAGRKPHVRFRHRSE
ncbi:hypothetical protein SKAU_G00199210 [Synaphobranchus kaupii]|uniref:Uncharacterized protein n=1 Tax=Synaphobranchus kaupii TaxID=118154 RepID=A0A9Q1IVY0_SYNKA|nr:hypothetical protein SKAU_G00199210 [Synaphobranchus kaupii]